MASLLISTDPLPQGQRPAIARTKVPIPIEYIEIAALIAPIVTALAARCALGSDALWGRKTAHRFRAHLHKPDIVVLDEATSALDPKSQVKLMELLTDQPEMTLLSIGHRPELEAFHTRKIELARKGKSAKLVRDVELMEPSKNIMRRWMRRVTGTAYRPAK